MRHAEIVTFGIEDRVLDRLRRWADGHGLPVRPTQHARACFNVLRKARQAIAILRIGRDLEQELLLLERISSLLPETATIVIGTAPHPALANLAWDLGAACVSMPLDSVADL